MINIKKNIIKIHQILLVLLLLILFFLSISCQTSDSSQKKVRYQIFQGSLITSKSSNFYIYENYENQFIFEKSIDLNFMLQFLDKYYQDIDTFLRINNITKEKIRNIKLIIVLFKSIENAFNEKDPIIKYILKDFIFKKEAPVIELVNNSMNIALKGNVKIVFDQIKEMFKKYNFTGVYNMPSYIHIYMKKEKFKGNKDNDIFLLESILLHEYIHHLFSNAMNKFFKKFIPKSDNIFEINLEEYKDMLAKYLFINESIAHFLSDYFEINCFKIDDLSDFKINELKLINMLKNKYKDNEVIKEKKDPSIISEEYQKHLETRQYFFDFILYLINLRDFEIFNLFLNALFNDKERDIQQLFEDYYEMNMERVFDGWRAK